jgi:hypothetical protein
MSVRNSWTKNYCFENRQALSCPYLATTKVKSLYPELTETKQKNIR